MISTILSCFRNFEFLIPDAPELIANFLDGEQDMSCKRNAFMMLLHADQDRALAYLASCLDQVASFGDILQLVIVELIYKVRLSIVLIIFHTFKNHILLKLGMSCKSIRTFPLHSLYLQFTKF